MHASAVGTSRHVMSCGKLILVPFQSEADLNQALFRRKMSRMTRSRHPRGQCRLSKPSVPETALWSILVKDEAAP